jgi:hypothetical protein
VAQAFVCDQVSDLSVKNAGCGVRADRLRGVLAPGFVKGRLSEGLGFADQLGGAIEGDGVVRLGH